MITVHFHGDHNEVIEDNPTPIERCLAGKFIDELVFRNPLKSFTVTDTEFVPEPSIHEKDTITASWTYIFPKNKENYLLIEESDLNHVITAPKKADFVFDRGAVSIRGLHSVIVWWGTKKEAKYIMRHVLRLIKGFRYPVMAIIKSNHYADLINVEVSAGLPKSCRYIEVPSSPGVMVRKFSNRLGRYGSYLNSEDYRASKRTKAVSMVALLGVIDALEKLGYGSTSKSGSLLDYITKAIPDGYLGSVGMKLI